VRLYHVADEGQMTAVFFSQAEQKLVVDRTHSSRYEEVTRDVRC
jgi:hypothetical protein